MGAGGPENHLLFCMMGSPFFPFLGPDPDSIFLNQSLRKPLLMDGNWFKDHPKLRSTRFSNPVSWPDKAVPLEGL